MRILSIVVVVASSLWGGYWFIGSSALEKGLNSWLSDLQSQSGPLQFSYSEATTQGFPNRFDTTIRDVSVLDSRKNISWSAEALRIYALSYKPNHIILEFPPTHNLTTPSGSFKITNSEMRGSVIFKPETALGLDHSAFVISDLDIKNSTLAFTIKDANFATRQSASVSLAHDVFLEVNEIAFPKDLISNFDRLNQLSDVIDRVLFDMTITLDKPIDRFVANGRPPEPKRFFIRNSLIKWGDIELITKGDLDISSDGTPSGTLAITVKSWRTLFELAIENGAIDANFATATESLLTSLANSSGSADTIDVNLVFYNGQMTLGPIPLGPAPRLF